MTSIMYKNFSFNCDIKFKPYIHVKLFEEYMYLKKQTYNLFRKFMSERSASSISWFFTIFLFPAATLHRIYFAYWQSTRDYLCKERKIHCF